MGLTYVLVLFMSVAAEMTARHDRQLAELAALGMGVAQALAMQVSAAETPGEAAEAAHAFERVSRAVRMCVALEQRLVHDRRRAERDDRAAAGQDLDRRKAQVKAAVGRAIENEVKGPRGFELKMKLAERLEEEALFDAFAEGPVERHIERIRQALGLTDNVTPLRLNAACASAMSKPVSAETGDADRAGGGGDGSPGGARSGPDAGPDASVARPGARLPRGQPA